MPKGYKMLIVAPLILIMKIYLECRAPLISIVIDRFSLLTLNNKASKVNGGFFLFQNFTVLKNKEVTEFTNW